MGGTAGLLLGHLAKAAAVRLYRAKAASMEGSLGLNVPGTPIGVSVKHPAERLKGMSRWVDRDAIERAYAGVTSGTPEEMILQQAETENQLRDPAIGAVAGAALGAWRAKNPAHALLGGVLGGAAGSLYNSMTANSRVQDTQEALKGVRRELADDENQRFPSSATEPIPHLLSTGGM